jgi:predicted nucleic acid-binding protein
VAVVTRYTADGGAMARYLVGQLPPAADEVFQRAEQGIDVIEAPTIAVSEAIWAAVNKEAIAGIPVDTTPNAVLRGLVDDGPVQVASADEQDLAVCGSLIDHHTLHDALLVANHRVRGTEAILTNDREFDNETTVWR